MNKLILSLSLVFSFALSLPGWASTLQKPLSSGTTTCMSEKEAKQILKDFLFQDVEVKDFFEDFVSFDLHYTVTYEDWLTQVFELSTLTLKWQPLRAQYETAEVIAYLCAPKVECHRGFAIRCDRSVQFWTDDAE